MDVSVLIVLEQENKSHYRSKMSIGSQSVNNNGIADNRGNCQAKHSHCQESMSNRKPISRDRSPQCRTIRNWNAARDRELFHLETEKESDSSAAPSYEFRAIGDLDQIQRILSIDVRIAAMSSRICWGFDHVYRSSLLGKEILIKYGAVSKSGAQN
jgi:hypothetical protein